MGEKSKGRKIEERDTARAGGLRWCFVEVFQTQGFAVELGSLESGVVLVVTSPSRLFAK